MIKNHNIIACIPARKSSSRLPQKLMSDIGGKPIIQHVYEKAVETGLFTAVYIAVDAEMYNFVTFTENKILTGEHTSGSSRISEAVKDIECDYVINIQGDEPFINTKMLKTLIDGLENSQIATLGFQITEVANIFDENKVKIVINKDNNALYFSRAPIPYMRNTPKEEWLQKGEYIEHIGIYAFKKSILTSLYPTERTALESTESLEQLNWLHRGYSIRCILTKEKTISIDTPEDLEYARQYFEC